MALWKVQLGKHGKQETVALEHSVVAIGQVSAYLLGRRRIGHLTELLVLDKSVGYPLGIGSYDG